MNIQEFTKLDFDSKIEILKTQADLIDQYIDNGNLIYNYQLNNFFVEATINLKTETMIDIIPFKRGFLLDRSYILKNQRGYYNNNNIFSYLLVA